MSAPAIWLLPGLDGTGSLFGALRDALGAHRVVRVFSYAPRLARFDALLESLPSPEEPVVLVAESFGGPLAVRLAARAPGNVRHLVLAASFVRAPRALPAALVALLLRIARRPSALVVRGSMVGMNAPLKLVADVRAATPRGTLAARMHEALHRRRAGRARVARDARDLHRREPGPPGSGPRGARGRVARQARLGRFTRRAAPRVASQGA